MSTSRPALPPPAQPRSRGPRNMTAALGVSDIDRSIAWYRDVLGFELIHKLDDWGWAELRSPIAEVNVGIGQTEDTRAARRATLTFGVADIVAARAALERARRDVRRRDDRGSRDGAARDLLRPRREHVHARAAARHSGGARYLTTR